MTLSSRDLQKVKDSCPGYSVVKIGDTVGAVCYNAESRPADRWEGKLLSYISSDGVWWTAFCSGKTRSDVIRQLQEESNR